jgi:hypothetical protein
MYKLIEKPILVAEHGYTVARHGLRPFRYVIMDDEERGELYRKYISDLAAVPYIIGNFYFIFKYMPPAGKNSDFEKSFGFGMGCLKKEF